MEVKNMLETKTKIWEKENKEKGRAEGREEGREEGRAEGREEGRAEGFEKGFDIGLEKTAINMIRNGEPDSKITLYTGLSEEQIEKLRTRIRKEKPQ
jgi:flagellar biosynthesis/type III secretory pathway protein FliH